MMDDPQALITTLKTVAMVGLSDKPDRPSHEVGTYLLQHGYTIIPVNPMVDSVFDAKSYPAVSAIPNDVPIDVVDIFRRPEEVIGILDDVVKSGRKPIIWMQEGVGSSSSIDYAKKLGFTVVANVCMMKVHKASTFV